MSIILNGTTGITTPDIQSAAGLDATDINDGAVTAAKLHTTAVTDKLGYTPLNKAGDSMSGSLNIPQLQGTLNCSPASPLSGVPSGLSLVYVSGSLTDNNWRTIVTGFNDFNGFIFACIGDQPVKDTGTWQGSTTSPAYGVHNFSNLHYTDNGWPSGAFNLRYSEVGGTFALQLQTSSYYSSGNYATGTLLFMKIG